MGFFDLFNPKKILDKGKDLLDETGAFGTDPSIKTQNVLDQDKIKVSNPLSNYLANEIGKGVPKYDGQLTEPINSYADYLGQAGDYYDKYIGDPATATYKRDIQPQIDESFAGGLRGSGRFGAQEDAANRFSEGLAANKATFAPAEAKNIWTMKSYNLAQDYEAWKYALPQNNPAIGQALSYLNKGTSTGVDVLSFLDQGKAGWFSDLLKTVATGATAGGIA